MISRILVFIFISLYLISCEKYVESDTIEINKDYNLSWDENHEYSYLNRRYKTFIPFVYKEVPIIEFCQIEVALTKKYLFIKEKFYFNDNEITYSTIDLKTNKLIHFDSKKELQDFLKIYKIKKITFNIK